ncbi:MAG: hypothetical protein QQN55_08620 [Nitrosopumilus sp.]
MPIETDEFWKKLKRLDERMIKNERLAHLSNMKLPAHLRFPGDPKLYEKTFSYRGRKYYALVKFLDFF